MGRIIKKIEPSSGFTIPELIVTIIVFAIVSSSAYMLLVAHISSMSTVQLRAAALSLATEQVEYLRSLPYDNLAIQGGSIVTSGTPLPGTYEETRASRKFKVVTNISYADDAFDGCLAYQAAQAYLCRNGPADVGKPVDSNPRDYKLAEVKVIDIASNKQYSTLSSQFTSRVAETAGNSSALLTTVLDSAGNPVSGATVRIQNLTTAPNIDQSTTTDTNGVALFLDVLPDTSADYVVEASKVGYSSLSTIAPNGSLNPTHPNVNAIAQQVSNVTLTIDVVSSTSLVAKVLDTNGQPLGGTSFVIRGGIKLYTSPTDFTYSYQQTVTTDGTGTVSLGSLTPGEYSICYEAQPNPCATGSSNQLLATRVAYGSASHQPFIIPAGTVSAQDGGPMQRIELVMSPSVSHPRITSVSPSSVSLTDPDIATSEITIAGDNLDSAVVALKQGATQISSTAVGVDSSASIVRRFDLSGASLGAYELSVTNGGVTVAQTGVLPGLLGGMNVIQ